MPIQEAEARRRRCEEVWCFRSAKRFLLSLGMVWEGRDPASVLNLKTAESARRAFRNNMPLSANSRLGPYEIKSALGVGGMGEVYRARGIRSDDRIIGSLVGHQTSGRVARS
jgi:hypothetical protein